MPVSKAPHADLRQRYPRYQQIGLALSLGLVILAFTVPVEPSEPAPIVVDTQDPLKLENVPATLPPAPPPPPPPAPPPPVEVPDAQEVDETLYEFVLDPEAALPLASSAPAPPAIELPSLPPPPPAIPTEDEDEGFVLVPDVQPELIGGLAALQARVAYPEMARRAGIEGQVVVQFVVDERGNVVDPVILRSPNDLLSEAAIKAVQESRFTPGQQRGRPVKVRFAVPVTFRLQ